MKAALGPQMQMPAHPPQAEGYRPDVDGLRAVAIVLVALFHARVPGFDAGFVGVDVFFVISGFLITRILLQELTARGRIDWRVFYARRMRRLFPALFAVLLASLVVAAFVLSPFGQLQAFSKSAAASSIYIANYFFGSTTGRYFDAPTDLAPLLHLWSLAVEEQFYVLFPLVLLVLWRVRAALFPLAAGLGMVAACSFLHGLWLLERESPFAYYSLLSRAWQPLAGALIAVWVSTARSTPYRVVGAAAPLVGVGLIVAGLVTIQTPAAHPGVLALLPTVGASLVLLGGSAGVPASWVGRALSLRIMVGLGKVSYPWYLWHWPMIAFARAYRLDEPDPAMDLLMLGLSLALAVVTYRYIEQPVMRRVVVGPRSAGRVMLLGTLAMAVSALCAAALGLFAKHNPGWRFDTRLAAYAEERPALRAQCHQDAPFVSLRAASDCVVGGAPEGVHIVLWGDSHADHLLPLIERHGREVRRNVLQRSFSGCPPWLGDAGNLSGLRAASCRQFNDAVMTEVLDLAERGTVSVVLGRFWRGEPWEDSQRRASLTAVFADTVKVLNEHGVRVLLVAPLPTFEYPAIECLARRAVHECSIRQSEFEAMRTLARESLGAVAAASPLVRIYDPVDVLCDGEWCAPDVGGTVMFWDEHHLTVRGAQALYPSAQNSLCWLTHDSCP